MTPHDWQRVTEIYEAALAYTPADRKRFLDDSCGTDQHVRREVESLLAHTDSPVVIDAPVWSMASAILDPEPLLEPGRLVGVYQILEVIGAGGMGVVYRARDTKLQRDVALKVLPEVFVDDRERLARFRREAHMLAALNHPNIAAIYDFEEAGDVHAIVLEHVDGPTLADRLKRSRMPVREALAIATQIADALVAAHSMGIVHRDLKPTNVKLRDDGTVKLLDFGLAKSLESHQRVTAARPDPVTGPVDAIANTPTIIDAPVNPQLTSAGMILGTVAYMAPEQFAGEASDKRGDVWAFGCVLYEMLAGRPAFEGADLAATRRAVLERDPDWTLLQLDAPRSVRRLLERCLQKDRRLRIADVAAAAYVLSDTGESSDSVALPQPSGARWWLVAAMASIVLLTLAAGVWALRNRSSVEPAVFRTTILPGFQSDVGNAARGLDISPDGSLVVYDVGPSLMLRPLGSRDARPVPNTESANAPFFSPDARTIGFIAQAEIRTVPVDGGPSTRVAHVEGGARGTSWGPDNQIYYAEPQRTVGLLAVPATGGEPRMLTTPNRAAGEVDHLYPSLLPDGQSLLFTVTGDRPEDDRLWLLDLSTLKKRPLDIRGTQPTYIGSGHVVYRSGQSLRAVPFDAQRGTLLGASFAIDEPITVPEGGIPNFAVSRNGTLVYGTVVSPPRRSLVWVDRSGREEPVAGAPTHGYVSVRISPDRRRVATDVRGEGSQPSIWIFDFERHTFLPLNNENGGTLRPLWLDDDHLLFQATRDDAQNLYRQKADGSGRAERMTTSPSGHFPYSILRNPLRVLFTELGVPVRADVGMYHDSDKRTELLFDTPEAEASPEPSPDGRWLAFQWNANNAPPWEIRVVPFADVTGQTEHIARGEHPAWTPDGRELLFVNERGRLSAASAQVRDGRFVAGTPRELLKTPYFFGGSLGSARPYDVVGDAQRFLMIKEVEPAEAHIEVVQNWFEEVKRLTPAD